LNCKRDKGSFLQCVLFFMFFISFFYPFYHAQTGEKCDPSCAKDLLSKAASRYDLQTEGTKPYHIVMDYSGVDHENKAIKAKIDYYWENKDKWREEIDTGNCRSVRIKLGGTYYIPDDQSPSVAESVCPAMIMMEPLQLFTRFSFTEDDKIECYKNKLADGTEVVDVIVSYGELSRKNPEDKKEKKRKNSFNSRTLYFSRAFRFDKNTGYLLLESHATETGFSETFKCQEMYGKTVPIYIRLVNYGKFSGQWNITKFEMDKFADPSLFATGQGFKKAYGIISPDDIAPLKLLLPVQPRYPEVALALGMSGKVIVEILINENGIVVDAKVLSTTAPIFSKAALEAAMKWRFSPPTDKNGNKVSCYYIQVINFKTGP
jgi:TonB family protein